MDFLKDNLFLFLIKINIQNISTTGINNILNIKKRNQD